MILFSKDKEIIFKIVNAIFLLWLIIALLGLGNTIINMLVSEKTYTYDEYKLDSCNSYSKVNPENNKMSEEDCKMMYDQYKYNNNSSNYYLKVDLLNIIANVIIVLFTLIILNRKKA